MKEANILKRKEAKGKQCRVFKMHCPLRVWPGVSHLEPQRRGQRSAHAGGRRRAGNAGTPSACEQEYHISP